MLNIAVAGLGTVGAEVVRLLQTNAAPIAARAGMPINVKAVSAKSKSKKRNCDLSGVTWVDEPKQLASQNVNIVVELMGGADGDAKHLAEAALKGGKHLVTANKALIAAHGVALAKLAEAHKAQLSYEAAVAGGIPVIKALREGLAGDSVQTVRGILNGTCNYILTRMYEAKLSFKDALLEAQKLGYAEADPASDIDGHDTANKLAILSALAFGGEPDLASVRIEGIRAITPLDLQFADELGCRVKLLGIARLTSSYGLAQRVAPALVSNHLPLAQVNGALNAVLIQSTSVGNLALQGPGAGASPTANAVIADIIDIARGHRTNAFSLPQAQLKKLKPAAVPAGRFYIRLQVMDKPGVVADIAALLRDEAISIESLLQRATSQTNSVPVVITTHAAEDAAMRRAAEKIAKLPAVTEKPCLLQIED
jgi:homoserine dehydrogenase